MVSIGKGEIGAAKVTSEILQVMENLPRVVTGLTGVDISKVVASDSVKFSALLSAWHLFNVRGYYYYYALAMMHGSLCVLISLWIYH